jgi:hypothetical protein
MRLFLRSMHHAVKAFRLEDTETHSRDGNAKAYKEYTYCRIISYAIDQRIDNTFLDHSLSLQFSHPHWLYCQSFCKHLHREFLPSCHIVRVSLTMAPINLNLTNAISNHSSSAIRFLEIQNNAGCLLLPHALDRSRRATSRKQTRSLLPPSLSFIQTIHSSA